MRLHWLTKSLSLVLTGLLTSDSITLSKEEVTRHYEASSSYVYAAANQQHVAAQFQAYQLSQSLPYLVGAAKQGHTQAAWLLYKTLKADIQTVQVEKNNADFWLTYLLAREHAGAIIEFGLQMVSAGQLEQLSAWLEQRAATLQQATLSSAEKDLLDALYALVALYEQTKSNQNKNYPSDLDLLQNTVSLVTRQVAPKRLTKANLHGCSHHVYSLVGSQPQAEKLTKHLLSLANLNKDDKYCFNEPTIDPRLLAICPADQIGRADCQPELLEEIKSFHFSPEVLAEKARWILMTKQGNANSREREILLDEQDSLQVLVHELAHWSGLIDEYRLRPEQQVFVCTGSMPYWPGKNVLVAPKSYTQTKLEARWQQKLYPVPTCAGTSYHSFKTQPQISIMEYFDLPLSEEYQELIFTADD